MIYVLIIAAALAGAWAGNRIADMWYENINRGWDND